MRIDPEEIFEVRNVRVVCGTLQATVLPLICVEFWGTWNVFANLLFSAAVLSLAVAVGATVWKPWNSPSYQIAVGPRVDDGGTDAARVRRLVEGARFRMTRAAITASAALTPWLVTGVSKCLGGVPFGSHPDSLHRFHPGALVLAALADGGRAHSIAMVWMEWKCRELLRSVRDCF